MTVESESESESLRLAKCRKTTRQKIPALRVSGTVCATVDTSLTSRKPFQ
jgi:hypothetical protein